MSVAAVCTVKPTGTLEVNQKAVLNTTITVTATEVQLTGVVPYCYDTSNGGASDSSSGVVFGSVEPSTPNLLFIPASGVVEVSIPFTPTSPSSSPAYTYAGAVNTANTFSLGAVCYFSDGSTVNATETTVTVVAPTLHNGR